MSYRSDIDRIAPKYGLDPDLVAALVEQESGGQFHAYRFEPAFYHRYLEHNPKYQGREPREVSASFGLTQVMYPTAVEHGFDGQPWDLFDPRRNLEIGCAVLSKLFAWANLRYRGMETGRAAIVRRSALAAYNGGKEGNNPTASLRNAPYADAVLARFERIRSQP